MKIGKYEFNSQTEAQAKIDVLGTATDEDGNTHPTHKNAIVHLGNIVTQKGTYDEEGVELTPPVLSDKYSIDVLWMDGVEPTDWNPFRIIIPDGQGSHKFSGLDYQIYKL